MWNKRKNPNLFNKHNNADTMPVKGSKPGSSLTGIVPHVAGYLRGSGSRGLGVLC